MQIHPGEKKERRLYAIARLDSARLDSKLTTIYELWSLRWYSSFIRVLGSRDCFSILELFNRTARITAIYKSTYVYKELPFFLHSRFRVFSFLWSELAVICNPSSTERFDYETAGRCHLNIRISMEHFSRLITMRERRIAASRAISFQYPPPQFYSPLRNKRELLPFVILDILQLLYK